MSATLPRFVPTLNVSSLCMFDTATVSITHKDTPVAPGRHTSEHIPSFLTTSIVIPLHGQKFPSSQDSIRRWFPTKLQYSTAATKCNVYLIRLPVCLICFVESCLCSIKPQRAWSTSKYTVTCHVFATGLTDILESLVHLKNIQICASGLSDLYQGCHLLPDLR
jgi:hypothetical protein